MNGDAGDRPFRPVLEALRLLLEPGAVAELRAIGTDGRVSSGYFDDPGLLATAAEVLDDSCEYSGVYVTLNPVNPALHARRANRVKRRLDRKDATTADGDILARRWLPVDLDPVRPSGVSATLEEHRAACAAAQAIRDHLAEAGWPAPIVADSGNGAHLLYRIDLANDDESTALVRGVLAALDARFSTAAVRVDAANYNAARIWKVYGTVSRKGDSTADRPHHRSSVLARPYGLEAVPAPLLQSLAASLAPAAAPARSTVGLDLGAWLCDHGVAVASEKPWQGGTLYTLAECPFSDAHADGAYAIQFGNGAVHAGCKHDGCGGGRQRWRELRERFEPRPAGTAGGAEVATSPRPDDTVVAEAREVLARGDPVRYFLDCFGRDHVGDTALAHCLVMSVASQAVRNSNGLHVYVTGESGKGKSSGMTAMLRQVPEEYRLAERLSNKALYYSDDISPGTVLMLDDIALSDELQEVLKEATSKFAEPVRMRSVDSERKVRRYTIPERCVWWLANVSALYDDQVLNRMLTCWVDDSEVQDREVFRRRMAAVARGDDGDTGDRHDLAVCREMWRQLRADGPVTIRVPFAARIRMASVRNRRNPEVLLDLVRAHALVLRFQRERAPEAGGPDGIVATGEDFRYAATLFAELHGAGGSLGEKLDRNEDVVLGLAARNGVESFTLRDVQRWTGWSYQKVRRLLLGRNEKFVHTPGLLDKSPALSLVDRTTSEEDEEGRSATNRQFVFLFDPELYRETRTSGLAWLDSAAEPPDHDSSRGQALVRPPVTHVSGDTTQDSAKGANCCENEDPGDQGQDHKGPGIAGAAATHGLPAPDLMVTAKSNLEDPRRDQESARPARCANLTRDLTNPVTTTVPERHSGHLPDPRAFTPTGSPDREPCVACGRVPTLYREKRGERRLCRACFARAVERERRRCPPLPAVIDPAEMKRVSAEIGKCDVCGLEPARWHGDAGRLCDACNRREVRRGIGAGAEAVGAG